MSHARGDTTVLLLLHELRRPITVIRGYASMLADGSLGPAAHHGVASMVKQEAARLEDVIDGVLGGGVQGADARMAVATAIDHLAGYLKREGAMVETTGLVRRPVRVAAGAPSLWLILATLIGNAVTFSPRPARVVVELRDRDPVEIAVRDEGFGIAEHAQSALFTTRRGASRGGLGVGLALSRQVAELNGGDVRLEQSELGRGSTFVLRLPRARAENEPAP